MPIDVAGNIACRFPIRPSIPFRVAYMNTESEKEEKHDALPYHSPPSDIKRSEALAIKAKAAAQIDLLRLLADAVTRDFKQATRS